jgi:hypothetical protein
MRGDALDAQKIQSYIENGIAVGLKPIKKRSAQ